MKLCTNCIPVLLAQSNLIPVEAQVFMVVLLSLHLTALKRMTSGRAFNHLNYFFKMYFQSATRKASVSSKQISLIFFGPECRCSKAIFQEMTNTSLLKLFIVA